MKTKKITPLESYFQTGNDHWNSFTFNCLVEAKQMGIFENLEQPLKLFGFGVEVLTKNWQNPIAAVDYLKAELAKEKLTEEQRFFVLSWIGKYLGGTEFDDIDTGQVFEILDIEVKDLRKAVVPAEPLKPLVKNLRESLKTLVQQELELLPETLKELDTEKRLNILCKLIPYVLPKVESVHSDKGENAWDW